MGLSEKAAPPPEEGSRRRAEPAFYEWPVLPVNAETTHRVDLKFQREPDVTLA